jgi:hypothetical protein
MGKRRPTPFGWPAARPSWRASCWRHGAACGAKAEAGRHRVRPALPPGPPAAFGFVLRVASSQRRVR